MTSQQSGFDSLHNRSESSSSANLSHDKTINGTNGLGFNNTHHQPSFTASTSSIPGALGISHHSTPTLTSPTLPAQEHSSRTSKSILGIEGAGESLPASLYQMRSNSSGSLLADGISSRIPADGLGSNESSHRPAITTSSPRNSNNNARNFLIPIGATGARQKLSILSASQRTMTGQKASSTTPPRPMGSSELSKERGEAGIMRRPQTGEMIGQNGSGQHEIKRPSTGSGLLSERQRSYSNVQRPDQSLGTSWSAKTSPEWAASASTSLSDRSGQWRSASQLEVTATPTQERPNPLAFRPSSSDGISGSGSVFSTTSQSSPSLLRESQSLGPINRSANGASRFISGDYESDQHSPLPNSNVWDNYQVRNNDYSPKAKQTSRPSSSSGRDRAAKLGAGFKSMFSKSTKDRPSIQDDSIGPPPSSSHSSTLQSYPISPSSSFQGPAPRYQQQSPSDSRLQPARSISSSGLRNHHLVDLNTAQSAGWTTLHESVPSTLPSFSSTKPAGGENGNRIEFKRAARSAPSLDFKLPTSTGLMDGFSSDQFFPLKEESNCSAAKGATSIGRSVKAPPLTGLNLEVAGQAIPPQSFIIDQEADSAARSLEKSLPPTPQLNNLTEERTSPLVAAILNDKEGKERNYSEASTSSSQGTILGKIVNFHPTTTTTTTTTTSTPLNTNQAWYNRVASNSSLSDTSRRGSNATAYSDANGSTSAASDSRHNPARRPSSSAQSTSGESNYSAPNSSRAWSPNVFEKLNAPMTSPLLASVLGQQQQQQQPQTPTAESSSSSSSNSTIKQRGRVVSPLLASLEGSFTDNTVSTPGTPNSNRSLSSSSTMPKPDLPTRSKERPAALQPDPATLAKLDNTLLTPLNAQSEESVKTTTPSFTEEDSTDTLKTPTIESKNLPKRLDHSIYVPPGALTYTRKGTAVRPLTTTNRLAAGESAGNMETPRVSMERDLKSGSKTTSVTVGNVGSSGQIISFGSSDVDNFEDETSIDIVNLLPTSAWAEVESALTRFKGMSMQTAPSDKGGLLRSVLLPFLALEAETPCVEVSGSGQYQSGKLRRTLFFEWIQHLLLELQTVQTSADRGAILESIACIIESRNFAASIFQLDQEDEKKFYSVFGHILSYAIGELNKKGVYQNTLIFSGRLLAVAFFRVEGVASKLLRALPVNRFALERVAAEAKWSTNIPKEWEAYKKRFPTSLTDFCFQDARSYLKMLDSHTNSPSDGSATNNNEDDDDDRYLVRQPEVEVEMSGNWLRRWQSDDSELFFSFCRSYHRQLVGLLINERSWEPIQSFFFGGPGYAHLATCIHQKCLSLVHRDILSVTTLSSQKNFNPGETANVLSGSTAGKPRHLEAANRRCTAIVVDIIRAPSSSTQIFGPILGIHVKSLVKRTSLYDVQGVFCLLDWLDGVLGNMETAELPIEKLVDVEFIIQTVWLLLKDADHALALMRTIAFCYSNFAVLTSTSKNRIRFCEEILLHPKIFQKLFLSWSFTIRAYFLHLLVFRLARINDFAQPEDDTKGRTAISVARLFNQRLDEIRKRHDELSPSTSSADSGSEDEGDLNRFKTRPQSFVSTIKQTPSMNKHGSPSAMTKAERVLGIGLPDPALSTKGENKAQSRAAKWLRALGGKGASKGGKQSEDFRGGGGTAYNSGSPKLEFNGPYLGDSPRLHGSESQRRMPKLDETDLFSDEDDDDTDDSVPSEDGGVSTPKAEGNFEFSFQAHDGHQEQQNRLGLSSGEVSPRHKGSFAQLQDDQDKSLNDHISPKLSFDLQSHASSLPPQTDASSNGLGPNGLLPVPTNHGQGRVSRAFSRRESILPGPAYNLVSHESESEEDDASKAGHSAEDLDPSSFFTYQRNLKKKQQAEKVDPYSQNLHIYAVQSLREYEQTVQEHDEFFAKQADSSNPQVPRLPIQWPAMWSE